jgi:hypothetical protein
MHGPINVKSPNNTSKWQMGFNSAFKGIMSYKAKVAVCYEIRTKHSTQNEHNVEFLNFKPGGT